MLTFLWMVKFSDQIDREKQRIELELQDLRATKVELQANVSQMTSVRMQIDSELHNAKVRHHFFNGSEICSRLFFLILG